MITLFVDSLKNCEPEFLISTPERLQELLSHGAIKTSDVSFLVILIILHFAYVLILSWIFCPSITVFVFK